MGFFNVDGRKRRKRIRGNRVSRPTVTGNVEGKDTRFGRGPQVDQDSLSRGLLEY